MPHGGMLSVKFLSVIEQSGRLQPGMVPILFGQYHIRRRNSPINRQRRVVPGDGSLMVGRIVFVAFVLENGPLAQRNETVGKTARNKELPMILSGQLHGHIPAERGRPYANIHGEIHHAPFDDAHQFALTARRQLVMQAAKHTVTGARLVVLYEIP